MTRRIEDYFHDFCKILNEQAGGSGAVDIDKKLADSTCEGLGIDMQMSSDILGELRKRRIVRVVWNCYTYNACIIFRRQFYSILRNKDRRSARSSEPSKQKGQKKCSISTAA